MSSSSAASSSSRASSEDLPEHLPLAKGNKSKAAQKAKQADAGRNEGVDENWAYKPPPGAVLLDTSADLGEFDWDALNADEDNELWLIRIPDGVKPKYLESAELHVPKEAGKTAKIGTIPRKRMAYDVWTLGESDETELPVCGEEIKGVSCLLPRRSKKGRLYAAPKAIARTLVIAAQEATPTGSMPVYQNPPREMHPKELLKHSFVPYGAGFGKRKTGEQEEVEQPKVVEKIRSKKRKGDEGTETPKKKKKTKAS
ncbi:hypothetical protein MIND_01000200 [Mycena indigotica]|uniref:Uncharacterized protein n=1 Tax=Mycena indigotica TaxID=2126181 RepID=A0A8H6S825_9AGAR|nr:uncharacterized protein MIND_01000200 [Mycena indigotica]KAF7294636.1 hypothetical protein MIND_01000200 [Mycena indigotica]